ncbi:hypothetical protein ACFPRA_16710 [Sporosarcina soli]|uniref:Uncharacterized protein n=1 Tax=Sporosarcina soli TaxID=334736 RepID=A0ABW0TQ67_9BACL
MIKDYLSMCISNTSINSLISLPDLVFNNYCRDSYRINRGIYNTIEAWFYKNGYIDILERRRKILRFLEAHKHRAEKNGKLRFGRGNLVPHLEDFEYTEVQGG